MRRKTPGDGPSAPRKGYKINPSLKRELEEEQSARANFVREWMELLHEKMTLKILAERAGVTQGTISHIRNQVSGFSINTIEKIARGLGITGKMALYTNPFICPDQWRQWFTASKQGKLRIQAHHDFLVNNGGKAVEFERDAPHGANASKSKKPRGPAKAKRHGGRPRL